MHITLHIPDELAASLIPPGQDPSRAALEALGLEAFRERRLSEYQLRTLLGLPSRWDLHALFKERKVDMYTVEEFEKDLATNEEFQRNHPVGSRA